MTQEKVKTKYTAVSLIKIKVNLSYNYKVKKVHQVVNYICD